MPAHPSHQRSPLYAAARTLVAHLRRIAAALAVVICGPLAPAAAVPASAAILIPNPHWAGRLGVLPSVPPPVTRVVTAGGWQITLIAAGAAAAAATAAVALDRALAAHRTGQAPGQ